MYIFNSKECFLSEKILDIIFIHLGFYQQNTLTCASQEMLFLSEMPTFTYPRSFFLPFSSFLFPLFPTTPPPLLPPFLPFFQGRMCLCLSPWSSIEIRENARLFLFSPFLLCFCFTCFAHFFLSLFLECPISKRPFFSFSQVLLLLISIMTFLCLNGSPHSENKRRAFPRGNSKKRKAIYCIQKYKKNKIMISI